jgi:hypothetical protein
MAGSMTITLISNSEKSRELYPSNTVARFKTHLFNEQILEGDWEIALTEVQWPISFFNVTKGEFSVDYNLNTQLPPDKDGVIKTVKKAHLYSVPAGFYPDIQQILDKLNNIERLQEGLEFTYDPSTRRVSLENKFNHKFSFSKKLNVLLGYEPNQNHIPKGLANSPVDLYSAIPKQLFVYCNLVEPQLVGDGRMSLLRVVGMEDVSKYGNLFTQPYDDNRDYYPIMTNRFQTIEIDIKTFTDEPAPFRFGPSLVKVHLRPVSRNTSRH